MKATLVLAALLVGCAAKQPLSERQRVLGERARPSPGSAAEERQVMVSQLRQSGESVDPWTREASAVFNGWAVPRKDPASGVKLSGVACFQAGCMATATYANAEQFEAFTRSFTESDAFLRWPGPKYRSPPDTLPDGRLTADWILFRAEDVKR